MRALFFGCWHRPGHYLVGPGGRNSGLSNEEAYRLSRELDGGFAPKLTKGGNITFGDTSSSSRDWDRYNAAECPQGQFLRHQHMGYTLIAWWDRTQGDRRGACNSTFLLEGEHTSEVMVAAFGEHFPEQLARIVRGGVQLVEVFV